MPITMLMLLHALNFFSLKVDTTSKIWIKSLTPANEWV